MIKGIHHIGIAVNDLEAALRFYADALGLDRASLYSETVAQQKTTATFLTVGETEFEFLEPYGDEAGPVHNFLAKRGAGVHHLCLAVDDIVAELAKLKAAGVQLVDEQPRIGARGHKVAFVQPKASSGVLIELVEEQHEPA